MNDRDLQEIIRIGRSTGLSDEDIETVIDIFRRRIAAHGFKKSFSEVSSIFARIVSKRVAVRDAVEEGLEQIKEELEQQNKEREQSHLPPLTDAEFHSHDEIESGTGIWKPADAATTKKLNHLVREPQSLFIYEGCLMRFTKNDPPGPQGVSRFAQGQVCRIELIRFHPNTDEAQDITVRIAKPGTEGFDANSPTIRLSKIPGIPGVIGKSFMKARRTQLPLTYHGFSTIHKSIGQTHSGVATKMSLTDKKYNVWQREQSLVLFSRVESVEHINFVGDMEDTFNAIRYVLRKDPLYWKQIEAMLEKTNTLNKQLSIIDYTSNLPLAANRALPNDEAGYVYILVSSKVPTKAYVGETICLARRFREHNSRAGGSRQTNSDIYKPWIVAAYIDNFPNNPRNQQYRRLCEGILRRDINTGRARNSIELIQRAEDLVTRNNAQPNPEAQLRIVHCAKLRYVPVTSSDEVPLAEQD